MRLKNKLPGARFEPLERAAISEVGQGVLTIRDGRGREYLRRPAEANFEFIIGGAVGRHTASLVDAAGKIIAQLTFQVAAHTRLNESSGQFQALLDLLYFTMADEPMEHFIRYHGKTYYFFVGWLRDHVHTLKGMKYFDPKLYGGIELYRDSQRQDGMIWDNIHRREPPSTARNHWGARFYYGDFERTFEDGSAQFTRIPVENDVEYLFVEGLYYTWKATGDDDWMSSCLEAAIRACEYTVNSPYRWSEAYGLLKRGHTIDTWDFQDEADCLSDYAGWPDPMAVHPDKTRFGIMFGDNTGYAVSCEYLAEMLERVGRKAAAQVYRQRSVDIRRRLDQIAWNGQFFTHHVPEDPATRRDLGVDETTQISLSNAYSLNRRISHEQCTAILNTYQDLKAHLPPGSPGEWYLIYPPFKKGYGGHNDVWQYMNGGVSVIVAGELAHGAFQHGYETYGVDILRRVLDLGNRYGGILHECYTGASFPVPLRTISPVNLRPFANVDTALVQTPELPTWRRGEHPDLSGLPKGRQVIQHIPFELAEGPLGALALANQPGYAAEIEIPIHARTGSIYLLHTLSGDKIAGALKINYTDGSAQSHYIHLGIDILPLSHWAEHALRGGSGKTHAALAWSDRHPRYLNQYVTVTGFDTDAHKEVRSITFKAAEDGAMWFVLGVALSDVPVWFPAPPISFGIPRGWGAAAVVYALLEGLAGAVDNDTAFRQAEIAPRWTAADVTAAEAVIHYPASDGYVAYRYHHDPSRRRISLTLTGSGEGCACHVLLPGGIRGAKTVSADGVPLEFNISRLEASNYVDFTLSLNAVREVVVGY